MRTVKVKRSQEEKNLGNLKLVMSCLHVCEATREETGEVMLDFYQIYNVTEVWNLEESE